ncbi:MAG: M56 family metallopeptidase [bacterium]
MTVNGISLPVSGQSLSVLLLKITLVLALAWLIYLIVAERNPRWRVLLWRGVVCGVLLFPLIAVMVPAFKVQIPRDIAFNRPISTNELPRISLSTVPETSELSPNPIQPVESVSKAVGPILATKTHFDLLKWLSRHIWVFMIAIWELGTLLLVIRMKTGSRWVHKILKNASPASEKAKDRLRRVAWDLGYPHEIELRYSSSITTPLLCGLWRPVILLPERMSQNRYEKRLRGIFAHEIAHLRSRDLWWFAGIRWAQAMLWFHPLMWRIRSVHAAACEELSDSVAAQYVGDAASYSQTLAQVALEFIVKPPVLAGIPMARSSKIRTRLKSLENPLNFLPLAKRRIALSAFLGCVALFCVAALQAIPTGPLFPLHGPSGEIVLGTGSLRNAAFSPDGQRVLTAGSSGMYLWDFGTGDFVRAFMFSDQYELGTLAFSPDGSKVLAIQDAWNSGPATVWDAGTGKGLFTISDEWFVSGAFSSDGGELILVQVDGAVFYLDADTGEEIWSYRLQKGIYQQGCVVFSPNGDKVLITGSAGTIVCDPASGGILFTYAQAIGSRVAVSHDGTQFLTGGTYDTEWLAALWDLETGDLVGVFELDQPVDLPKGLSFSPDDSEILILANPFQLDVWDLETWEVRHIETGIYDEEKRAISRFYSAEFSPDGATILVAHARSDGSSETALLLDAATGDNLRTITDHIQVTTLAFSHNNEVITASNANSVNVWNNQTGEFLRACDNFDVSEFKSVVFSPDRTRILASGTPVTLFDLETGAAIQTFGSGDLIAFSPNGRRVFTGRTQGEFAELWDAENGEFLQAFSTGPVESVTFSDDGRIILTSGQRIAKLWDAETGTELQTFGTASSPIECAALSPDGTKVVTARKNAVSLYDVPTTQELRSFQHRGRFPSSPIGSIAFSPDGMNVVTACEDTANLWDVATGQEIRSFQHSDADIGHPINSATFSPDGLSLVSAGDEILSKLWDTATGTELRTFSPAESSVIFSPNGTRVVIIGKDKTARIWDISDLVDGTGINYFAMY